MIKTLIYSCVFFNEKYIHLINLLLKSYKLFGNSPGDVDYLIICNPDFQKKIQAIFDNLNISGKIWCIDLKTIFEAGYSRLKIFNYPNINLYSKILYLDCDILVTNSINNILDFQLENKLYALQEGNTNHQYWGSQFFDKNTNCSAFTTGILLFNNNTIIKDLFSQILLHINNHITSNSPIPICLDQPFIVYHAIKNNLYNNQKLINIVINNPNNFNNETISHFPGTPGHYESKIVKMTNYMNSVMFNIDKNNNTDIVLFYNKIYTWNNSTITFLKDGNMNAFGAGKYRFIDKYLIKCDFGGREHLLKFNDDYSRFISIRKDDFEVISSDAIFEVNIDDIIKSSDKYKKKLIPKIIMQTAKNKPERYIIDIINQKCPKWTYKHFTDSEIIKYLQENPIEEFPNIIEKFNSFSKGQHKADIFRYYYLYLNGGIFLDSDAIFEVNIDDIIKSYDSVFVKSFMQNTHLFNGFIATYPKNPIIYDALKHAYYTEDIILQKQYHYLCEELWRIYHKHNFTNMKIYQEHNKSHEGYGGSVILDDNGDKIISHYWQSKTIAKPTNYKSEFINIYNTNQWGKGSGAGSYIENTVKYNEFIIDFINSNNIKSVVDLGCGDWQSSYLIYENLLNINYIGIDCVNTVIENNKIKHPKYKFLCYDFVSDLEVIKNGDLIILKDVLQHLELKDIYRLLDYITTNISFRFIIITNNGNQKKDDLILTKLMCGRGLHSNYLPLRKYKAIPILDYFGGENKHMCVIIPNRTDWNNYNTKEINEFDPRVLIGYDCPNPLIRVGPRSDGGYVMVDGFNYDHFLSCGIAGDIRFELALLDKYPNLKCDAFDGTINTFPRHNKNINWEKKNVGYINSEKITNLKPYLKDYKNIFLKMDIEGSEFNWIDSMSLEDLNCFSQIVMEIHWPFDKYRCEMLKKLNQTHYVVHIHGNNYCDRDIPKHLPSGRTYDGTLTINHSNYPSIKLTEVFEITYVRKSNFIDNLTKIEKKYPTSLDSPNNPNTEDIEFTILT